MNRLRSEEQTQGPNASSQQSRGCPLSTMQSAQSRKPARLTDLPDEALVHILSLVRVQSNSLLDIQRACALAATCRRLYVLFGRSIQTVNACYPTNDMSPPHRVPSYASPFHLEHILMLGGDSVRLLSLPPYNGPQLEYTMAVIARCCTRLTELSFFDFREENCRPLPNTLFGGALKTLRVCEPGVDVIQAIRTSNCCLEELVLKSVGKRLLEELVTFLSAKGQNLRVLSVTVGGKPEPDDVEGWSLEEAALRNFLHYLGTNVEVIMPALQTLTVGFPVKDSAWFTPSCVSSAVQIIEEAVARARNDNRARDALSSLKVLRFLVQDNLELLFSPLQSLVSDDVTVTVEQYRVCFVIPSGAEKAYMTSLLPWCVQSNCDMPGFGDVPASHVLRNLDMHKLDTLYIGECSSHGYDTSDTMHSDIISLIQNGSVQIREVRVSSFKRATFCSIVSDVLHFQPSVRVLEIPFLIVSFAATHEDARSLVDAFHNLRVLRLNAGGLCGDLTNPGILMPFFEALPRFLAITAATCRSLECLHITPEVGVVLNPAPGEKDEREKALDQALDSVDLFEATLPSVNADSMRQLIWLWKRGPSTQCIDLPCRNFSNQGGCEVCRRGMERLDRALVE